MPKRTDPKVVAYIVAMLTDDPSISYPQLVRWIKGGFDVTISIEGVKKIAVRELGSSWKKIDPNVKTYKCQFKLPSSRRHLKEFKGERGYSGANARYCPEHRTGKHSNAATEEEARKIKRFQSFLRATDGASPDEQKALEEQYFEELS